MRCLDLTDLDLKIENKYFDYLSRVDNLYIGPTIDSVKQVEFLKSLGIKVAIDLKLSNETQFDDRDAFEREGIQYIPFPIEEIKELSFDKLQSFSQVLKENKEDKFIYCLSGNRVGALLCLFLYSICGHPKRRAFDLGLKVGMKNEQTQKEVNDLLNA